MKKILIFIDWYLPGYKAGGPIRSMANMISSLKDEYCFYVICRNSDYLETSPYKNTKPDAWNQLSENENVYYISEHSLSIRLLNNLIKSMDFDVVYINGVYSFYFSILPLILSKKQNINKIIVAPRGMLSVQAFSAKKLRKKIFISVVRITGLFKKTKIHVTSVSEKAEIEILSLKPAEVILLPNLPPVLSKSVVQRNKNSNELKLVSIARISPEKNTLFALECLNYTGYKGKISYHIYGSVYIQSYWQQCLEIISHLPSNIEVVFKGDLNNNKVIETLQEYHFLYLPSQGENFGHSILESFIAGCPVIISNTTPWKNLEEQKLGWDLALTKKVFIDAIQNALDLGDDDYQLLVGSCREFALKITENKELKVGYKNLLG
jgi:glycosyltransferase involved in cell wall biosynthesis